MKRFDVGKVFHKSRLGGHPREALEASFDVIQEDQSKTSICEAETIFVASQIMSLLPQRKQEFFTFDGTTPLWYLRINHTRLADSILDLCGVPQKDTTRRFCTDMLTRFTAPSPLLLGDYLSKPRRNLLKRNKTLEAKNRQDLDSRFAECTSKHGLSQSAADKLRMFIDKCSPLPSSVTECIETLKKAITVVGSVGVLNEIDPRRAKRLEDAARSLRHLKDLFALLESLGVKPHLSTEPERIEDKKSISRPLFVSFDLGLRQRRKHYHGGLIYQCIALSDAFVNQLDAEDPASSSGLEIKVAEGGNYSELVRKHRPPGNFATAFVNYYTAAPLPACAGVRFSIGKLAELLYLDATSLSQNESAFMLNELAQRSYFDKAGMDSLRQTLGHPLQYSEAVTCLVASVHGMDAASTKERFIVASRLWAAGIRAEYTPHSGVMLSILKRLREDSDDTGGNSDWSLPELIGVCSLLNIPFVVIVQPHLLNDKGFVRLRNTHVSSSSCTEVTVSLDDLPNTILGYDPTAEEEPDEQGESAGTSTYASRDSRKKHTDIECIFVEHDQYYGSDREISKSETPNWKSYLKSMKGISLSAESFLQGLNDPQSNVSAGAGVPVFAVADASFWVVRDFGTALMRRENERSATGAVNEVIELHPKNKRVLKTLGIAIDNYMRQHGAWNGPSHSRHDQSSHRRSRGSSSLLALLLYSTVDDRFDMVTLEVSRGDSKSNRRR